MMKKLFKPEINTAVILGFTITLMCDDEIYVDGEYVCHPQATGTCCHEFWDNHKELAQAIIKDYTYEQI